MNPGALLKFMWGEYYYDAGKKTISKTPPGANTKIMFVAMVMTPLVDRYNKFFDETTKHNTSLLREMHQTVKEKFSKLMPMEHGILKMVVDHLPSPDKAQQKRIKVFCPYFAQPKIKPEHEPIKQAIITCNQSDDVPTTVYVTKMQPFSSRLFDITVHATERSTESQRLIGVGRVFGGCIKVG